MRLGAIYAGATGGQYSALSCYGEHIGLAFQIVDDILDVEQPSEKLGKTAGAGNKGQKSRRGYSRRRGFEGGQMPLHRRMPKRGFHNPFGVTYSVLNLEELNLFPAGETVTPDLLRAHGFIRRKTDRIKVLGDGELTTKLAIHAHAFSASAKEKISAAGGTFEVVA